jgi:hypothetical protein
MTTNLRKSIIYLGLIILSFFNLSCLKDHELSDWKKLGEISLEGKNLIIKVPKKDFKEEYIQFYLASIERTSYNTNLDAYKIGFYKGGFLTLDKDQNRPGNFNKQTYDCFIIDNDENNYCLEIPNYYLFKDNMRLWSAYEKEVFVDGIKFYRKKTPKINNADPYPYILISK